MPKSDGQLQLLWCEHYQNTETLPIGGNAIWQGHQETTVTKCSSQGTPKILIPSSLQGWYPRWFLPHIDSLLWLANWILFTNTDSSVYYILLAHLFLLLCGMLHYFHVQASIWQPHLQWSYQLSQGWHGRSLVGERWGHTVVRTIPTGGPTKTGQPQQSKRQSNQLGPGACHYNSTAPHIGGSRLPNGRREHIKLLWQHSRPCLGIKRLDVSHSSDSPYFAPGPLHQSDTGHVQQFEHLPVGEYNVMADDTSCLWKCC
jgi:hypothetical protein